MRTLSTADPLIALNVHFTVPRPMVSEPHDVLLKVTATTICGSDLHLYSGELPGMEKGDIVGHEFMVSWDLFLLYSKGHTVLLRRNRSCFELCVV